MLMSMATRNTSATAHALRLAARDSHLARATNPASVTTVGTQSMGRTPHPSFAMMLPPPSPSWRNRTTNHNTGPTASATARPAKRSGMLRETLISWAGPLYREETYRARSILSVGTNCPLTAFSPSHLRCAAHNPLQVTLARNTATPGFRGDGIGHACV